MTDFWGFLPERLERNIIPEPNSGCWIWMGNIDPRGYGRVMLHRISIFTHRLMYELIKGSIPESLVLDHLCRNPSCCNPDHLEPVTIGENLRRGECGKYQLKITHCPQGHPYNEANTYFNGKSRACRKCNLISTWRRRGKIR